MSTAYEFEGLEATQPGLDELLLHDREIDGWEGPPEKEEAALAGAAPGARRAHVVADGGGTDQETSATPQMAAELSIGESGPIARVKQRKVRFPKHCGPQPATAEVLAVEELRKSGDELLGKPFALFTELLGIFRKADRSPDWTTAACMAEILHWYTPTSAGHRKFAGPELQLNSADVARKLHSNPARVYEAMARLEELRLITREKVASIGSSKSWGNVQMIKFHPEVLEGLLRSSGSKMVGSSTPKQNKPGPANVSVAGSCQSGGSLNKATGNKATGNKAMQKEEEEEWPVAPGALFSSDQRHPGNRAADPGDEGTRTEIPKNEYPGDASTGPADQARLAPTMPATASEDPGQGDDATGDDAEYVAQMLAPVLRAGFTEPQLAKIREHQEYGRLTPEWADAAFSVWHDADRTACTRHGYFVPQSPALLLRSLDIAETSALAMARDKLFAAERSRTVDKAWVAVWMQHVEALSIGNTVPEHDYVRGKGEHPERLYATGKVQVWMHEHDERVRRKR